MIVNLKNKAEFELLMQAVFKDSRTQDVDMRDMLLCLEHIHQAIQEKRPVDLRFDTSSRLELKKGIITDVCMEYVPMSEESCKIKIEFQEAPDTPPVAYDFDFLRQNMEATLYNPETYIKFYICNEVKKVLVGIVIYFNRQYTV